MIVQAALYLPHPDDLTGALIPVAGRPVAFRAIVAAVRAGVRHVAVPAALRAALGPDIGVSPRLRSAVTWLDGAGSLPGGATLLMPASAVVPARSVRRILEATPGTALAESLEAGAPLAVLDGDAVRMLAASLVAGAPLGDALDRQLKSREPLTAPSGAWLVRVTGARAAAEVEALLYADLGSPIDSWLDVVVHRRLSRHVSRLAVRWGLTPNTVTLASLVVGLAAVWCFTRGHPLAALLGLAVYLGAVVLDHADGEVARLTLTESRTGEWLDVAVDTVIHTTLVLGMGAVAQRMAGAGSALGVVAAAGFLASAALAKWKPPMAQADALGGLLEALTSRDGFYAMLVMFVLALAGAPALLPPLMALVAAGAHAYWIARAAYLLLRRW